MKTIIQNIIIALIVISILLSLPFILKDKDFKTYSDEELRNTAISKGLKAIPSTYEELLKLSSTEDNPINKEKIILGKELFFDKNLSLEKNTNCATCHLLSKELKDRTTPLQEIEGNNCVTCHLKDESGTDRFATSIGSNSKQNPHHLNTMTILNSSLAKTLTWNGEKKSLEEYINSAIKASHKLNMTEELLLQRVKNEKNYEEQFSNLFKEGLTYTNIQKAIAVYVKTLLTRSSFDEFLEGDNEAISKEAKKGLVNFMNLGCSGCHTGMSVGGQSVQRFPLRNFAGIHDLRPNLGPAPEFEIIDNTFPFENKGGYKGRANTQFFRVPILRNVTKTSPYFHNGAVNKINQAVEIMGKHQVGINLTEIQIDEIIEFLKTLEGNRVDYLKEGTN